MISFRTAAVRGFCGTRTYDDGEAGTLQLGFTTYAGKGDKQTYRTTYVEAGGRSDHLTDVIAAAQGRDTVQRYVVDATGAERDYVGSPERNGIKPDEQSDN